ncbi:hypothetical protein FB451DRAFT_1385076 [Mycena latifolia]|nr:hypothetical protein FB451DRAFT_1385076 [Mycena latifolia]
MSPAVHAQEQLAVKPFTTPIYLAGPSAGPSNVPVTPADVTNKRKASQEPQGSDAQHAKGSTEDPAVETPKGKEKEKNSENDGNNV